MKEEEEYDSVSSCITCFSIVGLCFIVAILAAVYLWIYQ